MNVARGRLAVSGLVRARPNHRVELGSRLLLFPGPRPGGSSGTACPITRATATPRGESGIAERVVQPPLTASLVMVSWSSADCGEEEGL